MSWFYWNVAVSFVLGAVCFMTIMRHPDARIREADWSDDEFGR
ncbi:MAG: hypothetical protein ABWY18_13210 [Tardiphaga sp.]